MVPLVHGLGEGEIPGQAGNDGFCRILSGVRCFITGGLFVIPGLTGDLSEQFLHQSQHALFHHFLVQVRNDREGHARRDEEGPGEAAEVLRLDVPDGCGGAQDGQAQGMSFEEHAFELVIDILGRIVLVGDDLVQDDAPFGLDFRVGEGGFRRQFEAI